MAGHKKALYFPELDQMDRLTLPSKLTELLNNNNLKYAAASVRTQRCPGCFDVVMVTVDNKKVNSMVLSIEKWNVTIDEFDSMVFKDKNKDFLLARGALSGSEPLNPLLGDSKGRRYRSCFDCLLRNTTYFGKIKHLGE